jgi:hypothetical protein
MDCSFSDLSFKKFYVLCKHVKYTTLVYEIVTRAPFLSLILKLMSKKFVLSKHVSFLRPRMEQAHISWTCYQNLLSQIP